ncbi:LysR family transcriptional regulator [Amphritea pacifica]|uniref:LysR family transcriptional regulator n=1 Tax=Amphritea pacifica TaxID=2811233 RepID=A0ABS2W4D3_9GAMM|nr:LysR family transcriptional regulator [Amphritea pacifica]MBN0986559.1 LysR family transcriptional regulator [Amphritea pacifica]MBN1006116.1 LysR family transcriptional regulator [Amphritea pacifica]
MKYSLRQLEVFLAVAHFDNISRAAESLSMSQSAVSGALRDLEAQFDIQLFDRVGKRLKINELGRLLRPRAESLLERARSLEQDMARHEAVGELKIGATMTIGNYLAVGLIARYLDEQPRAKLDLQVANTSTIAARLINFDLDIGLVEGEVQHPDLEVIPWLNDRLEVFCAPDHPLTQKPQLSDTDLLSARWILREQGSGTRQAFDWALHGLLPNLNVLLELEHAEGIKQAVAQGLGIGCLSRIALQESFELGTLVPLWVAGRDFSRQLYLVINKHKYRSAGIERWIELCHQA